MVGADPEGDPIPFVVSRFSVGSRWYHSTLLATIAIGPLQLRLWLFTKEYFHANFAGVWSGRTCIHGRRGF